MIKTVILDDDINSQKAATAALKKYDDIEIVGKFENSQDLFEFLEDEIIDLLFLDIELNEEFGLEIAQKIRELYPQYMIIFFTGHASYAIDGYDFQPISFLTKPINHSKLEKAIENVRLNLSKHQKSQKFIQIMIKTLKGYQMIMINEIYYIEHKNRKNYLMTLNGEQRIANYTVKELEKILEPYGFYCCHQSFIIPLSKVKCIDEEQRQSYFVSLKDIDKKIPVSRNKYEELRELLLGKDHLRL